MKVRWLLGLGLLATALIGPGLRAEEPKKIEVTYLAESPSQRACAEALRDSIARFLQDTPVVLNTTDDRLGGPTLLLVDLTGEFDSLYAASLVAAPFSVRDPEHYQKFIQSDLFRDLREIDRESGRNWAAIAYGGFYHLFSGRRAMTEPKHFFARTVGGANHARMYLNFDAKYDRQHFGIREGEQIEADAAVMAVDDDSMAAIEATLLEAYRFRLQQRAHFLNLSFSKLNAVFFRVVAFADNVAGQPLNAKIQAWAEAAAQTCGAANFEAERKVLDDLKKAGLTIVPFNRAAVAEAGWRYALSERPPWIIDDLDRFVKLASPPAPKRSPSALVASLQASERTAVLQHNAEQVRKRAKFNIQAVWRRGIQDLVGLMARTPPPPVSGAAPTTRPVKVSPVDARVALRDAEQLPDGLLQFCPAATRGCGTPVLERLCAASGNCGVVVDRWAGAAITLWESGERAGALILFEGAERLARRQTLSGAPAETALAEILRVLSARVSVADSAVRTPLKRAVRDIAPSPGVVRFLQFGSNARLKAQDYLLSLAPLLSTVGDEDGASEALEAAMELAGGSSGSGRLAEANLYVTVGKTQDAWDLFTKAVGAARGPRELRAALEGFKLQNSAVSEQGAKLIRQIDVLAKSLGVSQAEILP